MTAPSTRTVARMPPPRAALPLLLVLLALVLVLAALGLARPGAAQAAVFGRWRWPVEGRLVARYRYSARHPFTRAQRRGIDIAAPVGAGVRAACAGQGTFAGRRPTGALAVSVRCGTLVATHVGLRRLAVRRGARVAAGTRLGTLGPRGLLRLGARRGGERFGYVDPLALLVGGPPSAPALPLGRAPRAPAAPVVFAPRPRAVARRQPVAATPPAVGLPSAAWAGLLLLAAGLPAGSLVRRRGHRRRARAAGAAIAEAP